MASYAGYNAAGLPGAIVSTLALTAPALIIIVLIAKFLESFSENATVKSAFYGIRPVVAYFDWLCSVGITENYYGYYHRRNYACNTISFPQYCYMRLVLRITANQEI